jgi:hypothetical protein
MLRAADYADALGIDKIWVLEFGVAPGTGLLNMCRIADRVTATTGVAIELVGFDTGSGMPPPRDYRDHPERYAAGDFPMDREALDAALPPNAQIEATDCVVGFAAVDVDYYWSTVEALKAFAGHKSKYLPMTLIYFDDIRHEINNPWCGELLAIQEFNETHTMRKISPFNFLRNIRIKKKAPWIDQVYVLNVLDHPSRLPSTAPKRAPNTLPNDYLTRRT